MSKISVALKEKSYDIIIDEQITIMRDFILQNEYKKIVIVTDENVDKFYSDEIDEVFRGFNYKKVVLPAGEPTKSQQHLSRLYSEIADFALTRGDAVVAFGGGVIGDLTGFAAATFCRGVPLIQIPTTLLAQVDSSVGGKVAINLPQGKNLVGSFYQPKLVVINTRYLKTLPERIFADGMAEVIKYALIRDADLFEALLSGNCDIADIIARCCKIKAQIVQNDEFDTSERMILNFGHTLGHALEQYYNYEKYTHGEAVAIGMYCIAKITEQMKISLPGTAEKIRDILINFNLPYEHSADISALIEVMRRDKKMFGAAVNLVVLKQIGEAKIHHLSADELEEFWSCKV